MTPSAKDRLRGVPNLLSHMSKWRAQSVGCIASGYPPPLLSCCLDKGVAHALHCAWHVRKDLVYYSENQGAKYATKAIMPQSASLTQNVTMHLKTQVSDSTRSTQLDQMKICTAKIHGAKIDGTNA